MNYQHDREALYRRALAYLRSPRTCSELGAHLWGTAARNPQAYARPAGRLLNRLAARGLVELARPLGWKDRARQWQAKVDSR